MTMEERWETHKTVLGKRLSELGLGDVGYAFDVFEDDKSYYYSLLLSSGDGSSAILFRVNEDNLVLDKIEYETAGLGEHNIHDITQDMFANDLWDMLYDTGTVHDKWEERYNIKGVCIMDHSEEYNEYVELFKKNPVEALYYLHQLSLYCAEGMDGEQEQEEMFELTEMAYQRVANTLNEKE